MTPTQEPTNEYQNSNYTILPRVDALNSFNHVGTFNTSNDLACLVLEMHEPNSNSQTLAQRGRIA